MSIQATAVPIQHDDRHTDPQDHDVDYNFLPDFGWAAIGGVAALAVCALVLWLIASLGGGPPITSYTRELAGIFLAGFLVVLVARSVTGRTP